MKIEITMPKLSPQMEKGILVSWCKQIGDTVAEGEPLFEVETDKVVSEVESPRAGVLQGRLAGEGDEVAVGTAVAVLSVEP